MVKFDWSFTIYTVFVVLTFIGIQFYYPMIADPTPNTNRISLIAFGFSLIISFCYLLYITYSQYIKYSESKPYKWNKIRKLNNITNLDYSNSETNRINFILEDLKTIHSDLNKLHYYLTLLQKLKYQTTDPYQDSIQPTSIQLRINEHTYTEFNQISTELQEFLYKKNIDYGDDNLIQDGITGIIVRLSDKLSRLRNITKNNNTNFESQEDNFKDIQGYAINQIRLLREERI